MGVFLWSLVEERMSVASTDTQRIQTLIDQLKHDDAQVRISAVKQIAGIAVALGPCRTRSEFIPFLSDCTEDEDEVLEVLAVELGTLLEYLGGAEFASELAKDETSYTANSAAAEILASIFSQLSQEQQVEVKQLYTKLIAHPVPLVRRIASSCLGKLASTLSDEEIWELALPTFTDHQDSVRYTSVDTCVALCSKYADEKISELILPKIVGLASDESWRVRYTAADRFIPLAQGTGKDIAGKQLLPIYIKL